MSTETTRLIRDGEGEGGKGYAGGKRGRLYLSLHCHHQNDSCIQMGSDESHFNVSLICEGQNQKTMSRDHNFWRGRRAEADSNWSPSAYQPNALPLDKTGWQPSTNSNLAVLSVAFWVTRRQAWQWIQNTDFRLQNLYCLWITQKFALRPHKRYQ